MSPRRTAAGDPHRFQAFTGLKRPNQDRLTRLGRAAHDIHAEMHAVGEVDVGMPTGPPHRRNARGTATAKGVTGPIWPAGVGLGLDDDPGPTAPRFTTPRLPHEQATEEERGQLGGWKGEIRQAVDRWHGRTVVDPRSALRPFTIGARDIR